MNSPIIYPLGRLEILLLLMASFFTDPNQGNKVIEIGKVDETKNGQNGTTLRINFHKDATIPGTSNLANGDFSHLD